jgi:hypothetical protein
MGPLDRYEKITEAAKIIFTNSLKQFVISIVSQLILVAQLEPNYILNVISTLNLLFIFGRFVFSLGYSKHRSFSFALTSLPTTATMVYNIYNFTKIYF